MTCFFEFNVLDSLVLVGYVHLVVNLYGIVADAVVGHGYKLRFTFSYGSDN